MKAWQTIRTLLLTVLLAFAAVILVAGVGTHAMRVPDADPQRLALGAMLSQLRDGETLSLARAYPDAWDEVLIANGPGTLTKAELTALFSYAPTFTFVDQEAILLLFWKDGSVVSALQYQTSTQGYPRFLDGCAPISCGHFRVKREDAMFACTFVAAEEGAGGHYECVPVCPWRTWEAGDEV